VLSPAVRQQITTIVGADNVLSSYEDRLTHAYDATPVLEHLPELVVRPRDPEQISALLRLANDERFCIVPRGSGTGLSGGSIPTDDCVVLLLPSWNRILEIDEENLTAWVEPGVVTAGLHAAVEAHGLFYPPDPGSMKICTIGGNVAENSGGLRGLKYGVTKDYVMGLELVLPTGERIVTGGKTVKDVAGYNLKDLFIGSEGTLGVFTRILVKLIPKPESAKTILALFDTVEAAAEAVSAIIAARIVPSMLEFLDQTTIRCVEDFARIGLPTDVEALLLIEVDGRRPVVEEDAERISELCRKHQARNLQVAADAEEADRLKTARRSAFSALARVKPATILEDATVPRSEVATMVRRIQEIGRKYDLTIGNFGHAGDGNLHPTGLVDERDRDEMQRAEKAFEEIFEVAIELGGTITGEHGVGLAKKSFLPKQVGDPAIELMRKFKSVVDPNGVLNPGKIFDPKPRCEDPLPRGKPRPEILHEALG
jgi:glycolate oxidase